MTVEKKIELIYEYLDSKDEKLAFELIIKDYNASSFYIAIVFCSRIEKFKVLYIPLDVVENANIDYYVCYQFINIQYVNYLLQNINNAKDEYNSVEKRNKLSKNLTNFYIQITVNVADETHVFKTTKYIPKEWLFLFDPLVILFEHTPNIMGELCHEILSVLTNSVDPIDYKASVNFDLFEDDYSLMFSDNQIKKGNEYYEKNRVKFLEKVEGKYFAIVKDHIVIIEYNKDKKILNAYCDCSCHSHGRHIYSVIRAIREDKINKFYKLMVVKDKKEFDNDKPSAVYYLCYGLDNDFFKVIKSSEEELLPIDLYKEGKIKIIEDKDNKLLNDVNKKLKMSS